MKWRMRTAAGEGVNLGIVITPMLDMSFQLLAFFIMTYHPSALEAHIDGKLLPPPTIALASGPGTPPPKKDNPLPVDQKPDDEEIVRVSIRKDYAQGNEGPNQPFDLLVELKKQGVAITPQPVLRVPYPNAADFRDSQDPSAEEQNELKKPPAQRDPARVPRLRALHAAFLKGLDGLRAELVKTRKELAADRRTVIVDPAPNILYGYFIAVQDACKGAGFDSVGFGAPVSASP